MIGTKIFICSSLPPIIAWSITPADATSLASALSILIAAIFVGLVNIIAARAAARAAIAPIAKKIDQMEPLVTKIDAHVNSEKTRAEGEIANYKSQIEMQRVTIDDLKKASALLAQAKAIAEIMKTPQISATPIPPTVQKVTIVDQVRPVPIVDANPIK